MSRLSKSSFFGRCVLPGFASLLLVNASWGHPDDPKAKSILPPYEGPGFLAGEGGVAGTVFPSNDVTLLAWIPPGQFGASWANDCWGYVSPSGREYAIIGLSNSTGFVEVTNPGNAQIVATIAGPGSVWRDIKVYQTYAYAVSEAGSGIQVIDLSQIDEGTVELVNTVTTGGGPATHNVAINEDSGYLYRTGGGGNGLRIYSLADPANPTFVASWPDRYVHDAQIVTYTEGPYAGKEIAFCCSGFNGGWVETGIDILDVTDKQDIQLLARYQYPFAAYSHQAWLSPDRQYLYLNDELNEQDFGLSSTTHIIDVSDLSNPFQATAYTNGSTAITHNLYVRDNLIFASNYRSGLRVYDISEPLAPVEIAYFDTFPENNLTDFNGLWSNYPFLPSGIVIGSDRERGLFVWDVGGPQLTFSYPNGRPLWLNAQGESIAVQVQVEEAEVVPDSATLTYDQGQGPVTVDLVPAGDGLFEAVFPAIECVNLVSYYLTIETDDGTVSRRPPRRAIPELRGVYRRGFPDALPGRLRGGPRLDRGGFSRSDQRILGTRRARRRWRSRRSAGRCRRLRSGVPHWERARRHRRGRRDDDVDVAAARRDGRRRRSLHRVCLLALQQHRLQSERGLPPHRTLERRRCKLDAARRGECQLQQLAGGVPAN